jgi:hypothetical protein
MCRVTLTLPTVGTLSDPTYRLDLYAKNNPQFTRNLPQKKTQKFKPKTPLNNHNPPQHLPNALLSHFASLKNQPKTAPNPLTYNQTRENKKDIP